MTVHIVHLYQYFYFQFRISKFVNCVCDYFTFAFDTLRNNIAHSIMTDVLGFEFQFCQVYLIVKNAIIMFFYMN